MRTERFDKLSALVALFVLFVGAVSAFGQNQQWMSIGNPDNPQLCSYLLEHSIYADDILRLGQYGRSPLSGIVGAANIVDSVGPASWEPNILPFQLQSEDGGRFRNILPRINNADRGPNTGNVFYNSGTRPTGNNVNQQTEHVYPTETKPKFPGALNAGGSFDLGSLGFGATPSRDVVRGASAINEPGHYRGFATSWWPEREVIRLRAGTYHFYGDVRLDGENHRLIIEPDNNGNYRTTIYISGRLLTGNKIRIGPPGFVDLDPPADGPMQNEVLSALIPPAARGQILFVVAGSGPIPPNLLQGLGGSPAAVHIGWQTRVVGTIIAPNGGLYIQSHTNVFGQLLANQVFLNQNFDGGHFIYEPITVTNLTMTFPNKVINKTQCVITTGSATSGRTFTPFVLSEPLASNYNMTLHYRIVEETARHGVDFNFPGVGVGDSLVVQFQSGQAQSGMPVAGQWPQFHVINNGDPVWHGPRTVRVVVDSIRYTTNSQDTTISTVSLEGTDYVMTLFPAEGGRPAEMLRPHQTAASWHVRLIPASPAEITVTIQMSAPEVFPPTLSDNAFTQAANAPIERHNNPNSIRAGGANQVVGNFQAAQNIVYEIAQNYSTSGADWFAVSGNQLITTNVYDGNFDTGLREIPIRIIARNTSSTHPDCVRESEPREFTIQIRPWNNNAFVTVPEITSTVPERGTVSILPSDWFISDADELQINNRHSVRGFSATNLGLANGAWNNADANTGSTTFTTAMGANVSIQNGNIFYDQRNITERVSGIDRFFVIVRDWAVYGYDTDHFDRAIEVSINVERGNFSPPLTHPDTLRLCKYETATVLMSDLVARGIVTDEDLPDDSHYFTGTPRTFLQGTTVSIVDGNLFYNTAGLAPSLAVNGTVRDTIYYQVTDAGGNVNAGQAKIFVIIDPTKDLLPTGEDTTVAGIANSSMDINVGNRWATNYNNTGIAPILAVHEIVEFPLASTGVTVSSTNPDGGFRITVPIREGGNFEYGDILQFKYTIIDNAVYACDDSDNISEPITVFIVMQEPDERAAIPVGDTIIVNKAATTDSLWNGSRNIMDNDLTSEGGANPARVVLADSTTHGRLTLNSDGTFLYEHDGGNATRDRFTYWLYSDIDDTRSDFTGEVTIFINLLNLNDPDLTPKTGSIDARASRIFTVIDANDSDDDIGTTLKIDRNTPITTDAPDNAIVEIASDNTLSFRYDGRGPATVVVTFFVNDSVNYTHRYNNNGVLSDSTYIAFGPAAPYRNTLTVTVTANPEAVDYRMSVRELESTNELIAPDGSIHTNLRAGISSLSGLTHRFVLKEGDSTQNGRLRLEENGAVTYWHENPAGLEDGFTYLLIVTLSDGTRDTTEGRVDINIRQREPQVLQDGSLYEDVNADGKVDKITIAFDRKMNANDRISTGFEIHFAGRTFGAGDIERFGVGVDESGDDDSTVVVLWLNPDSAPVDVTDGEMRIIVTYNPAYDAVPPSATVIARDMAAPVIVSARAVKSLVPDGNDTLIVTLSEALYGNTIPIGGGNFPFKFVDRNTGELYDISFDRVTPDGNNVYTLVVSSRHSGSDNGISALDSMFINWDGNIRDIGGVFQTNPDNKRVEITMKTVTQIYSAVYLDTGSPSNPNSYSGPGIRDGYIDIIRVDMGEGIVLDQAEAEAIAARLALSPTRRFTKGEVTLNSSRTGFDLRVVESRENDAKTDLYPDDNVSITGDQLVLRNGSLIIDVGSVRVIDSLAPVILRAYYRPTTTDTTLVLVFSEPVDLRPGDPYKFWNTKPQREYLIGFAGSPSVSGASATYRVNYTEIAYPVKDDSIWIALPGVVFDLEGNEQASTVRAPLIVEPYPMDLKLHIVPQPLRLVNVGGRRQEPMEFNKSLMEYYEIPPEMNRGVAVVLEAKGPISDVSAQRGFMRIIDQTGNAVSDNIEMNFEMTERGSVAGVAVWDGKNRQGRTVGPASYLALVQVEVKFDDRDASEVRSFREIITVTATGSARD